jgi:hypothetical protein
VRAGRSSLIREKTAVENHFQGLLSLIGQGTTH